MKKQDKPANRNHGLIAGACIVGLAIGYLAGGTRGSSATAGETNPRTSAQRPEHSSPRDRTSGGAASGELLSELLKGKSIRDLPTSELVDLLARLLKSDPSQDSLSRARQSYQLQLLLAKLSPSQLEKAAEAIAGDPEGKLSELNTIVSALAGKDPYRALDWAKSQPNSSKLLTIILGNMAKDNPREAADLFHQTLLENTLTQNDAWLAVHAVGRSMGQLGTKSLLEFIDRMPMRQQGNLLASCMWDLPENERTAMLDETYQRSTAGQLQDWGFNHIFAQIATLDPDRAEAWLEKLEPGKERALLGLSRATSLVQAGEDEKAHSWMSRAIAQMPGKELELLNEVLNEFGTHYPDFIASFTSRLPANIEVRAEHFKNQTSNMANNGFSALPAMARAISDPMEQSKLITEALNNYTEKTVSNTSQPTINATDFHLLTLRLNALGISGDKATEIEAALAKAKAALPKPRE